MAYSHNANDITPQMTANNAPSPYVASASSVYSNLMYDIWKAFNHDGSDGNQWIAAQGSTTGWLKFYFGGNSYVVTSYSMYCASDGYKTYLPKNWTFQGSNDDSTWDTLDTRSNITWTADQTQTFSFSNSTGYKYYRINVTAIGAAVTLTIFELEMFGTLYNPFNGLQKIPHDTSRYAKNPIDIQSITNRQRIGIIGTNKHNYIGA